jgi:hypothetical protein
VEAPYEVKAVVIQASEIDLPIDDHALPDTLGLVCLALDT